MSKVHFLNVGNGSCSIIQHASGRVSMIDICNGSPPGLQKLAASFSGGSSRDFAAPYGDFKMRDHQTNPIEYLLEIGVPSVFRFILSHPDMDHMDGLKALNDAIAIQNFWDSGVRREKPQFGDNCTYREEDWDQYESLCDGNSPGVTVVRPRSGSRFQFANKGPQNDSEDRGDYLTIVAPSTGLVQSASESGDANDGSYVLVYRSCGGKIVFGGDAHDDTWDYILEKHRQDVENCAVLIAPHHGRDSDRSYDFLDVLAPKLTLFGCAPSAHLGYGAWSSRNLKIITNNQAGNIILNSEDGGISVCVENQKFASNFKAYEPLADGYSFIGLIAKPTMAVV